MAGQVRRQFGGGRMLRPMELVIGDRATSGLIPRSDAGFEVVGQEARLVIVEELACLTDFCVDLTGGRYPVC